MSSAPASLASPAASTEAFAQPASVNHGVSDHLSASIFQPLPPQQLHEEDSQYFVEGNRRREGHRRERVARKSSMGGGGGPLNPFAKEFVPVNGPPAAGRAPSSAFDSQFDRSNGRNKGSQNGKPWRPRGAQDPRHSVIFREDVKKSLSDSSTTGPSLTNSVGGLSTALRRGSHGQTSRRASPGRGDQSSSTRVPGARASSSNSRPGTTPVGSRKGQGSKANHLLNFQYDPITRPAPRAPQGRRPRKPQPFNKELFLQANFRFLVSDFGDYMLNTADPDRMLEWEDVAAVNFAAPEPVQCPICLDLPLCPQITTCGHIFCFPCVLRYLLMGVQDSRGEQWKKCPLCFAMISYKELRTLFIDDVHHHRVGDTVRFTLLMRAKGSIIPFEKTELARSPLAYSKDGQCHLFSKFTLTSDAEPTTNKAVTELTSWAERVQQDGGEDIDLLPFVFVAIDQLRQRKDSWAQHRETEFLSSSPPVRQRIIAQSRSGMATVTGSPSPHALLKSKRVEVAEDLDAFSSLTNAAPRTKVDSGRSNVVVETQAAMAELKDKAHWVYESAFSDDEADIVTPQTINSNRNLSNQSLGSTDGTLDKPILDSLAGAAVDLEEFPGEADSTDVPVDFEKKELQHKKDQEERDTYTFYQSADGQMLILHPFNVKCLLHHYGNYEALPTSLEAELVQLETLTQTDLTRKRYRYLSHLPLTAVFQLCEVDLSNCLPMSAFIPFAEELGNRESRRHRILMEDKQQRELDEKTAAAEVARYTPPTNADFAAALTTIQNEEEFSSASVEDPLGSSPVDMMSPPENEERKLFSCVAKLGFASGYDAPDLMSRRPMSDSPLASPPTSYFAWASQETDTSEAGTSRGPISFADIIVAQASKVEQDEGLIMGKKIGSKKGKKGSKIIMSTSGGRRY